MASYIEILNEFNIDYTVAPHIDGALVLFLFPYQPFEEYPEGYMFLDNYYLASNTGHQITAAVRARLGAEGYETEKYRAEKLKPLAVRLGRAAFCKNDLVYTPEYGSYFYIDALKICGVNGVEAVRNAGKAGYPAGNFPHGSKECSLCISACPNSALSENGFDRNRCLRQFMDKRHNPTEEERALIGDRLMGCAECRAVCPLNAHIRPVPIPPEVLAATKKGSIDYNKLKELIGGNLFKI